MKGIVLFAHGARDRAWARPIEAIAHAMQVQRPEILVLPAYLEHLQPGFNQAIDALVQQGCDEVVIVPIFMADAGHTQRDLPALIKIAQSKHPHLALKLARPIGEAQIVVQAIADYALQA